MNTETVVSTETTVSDETATSTWLHFFGAPCPAGYVPSVFRGDRHPYGREWVAGTTLCVTWTSVPGKFRAIEESLFVIPAARTGGFVVIVESCKHHRASTDNFDKDIRVASAPGATVDEAIRAAKAAWKAAKVQTAAQRRAEARRPLW